MLYIHIYIHTYMHACMHIYIYMEWHARCRRSPTASLRACRSPTASLRACLWYVLKYALTRRCMHDHSKRIRKWHERRAKLLSNHIRYTLDTKPAPRKRLTCGTSGGHGMGGVLRPVRARPALQGRMHASQYWSQYQLWGPSALRRRWECGRNVDPWTQVHVVRRILRRQDLCHLQV
jgi:hypothetical protein